MADETRTPEQLAAEVWSIAKTPNMARDWGEERIAALIREDRKRAFDAGVETGATHGYDDLPHPDEPIAAARRLAVEGRSDG